MNDMKKKKPAKQALISQISPGEFIEGMHVVIYETRKTVSVFNPFTGATEQHEELLQFPWFRGIPYVVRGVALPILMVENPLVVQGQQLLVFIDTRFSRCIEVSKEYFDIYKAHMAKQPAPPKVLSASETGLALANLFQFSKLPPPSGENQE